MIATQRGSGMSNQAPPLPQKPYRYKGIPGWNPAAGLAGTSRPLMRSQAEQRRQGKERKAEFARLRAEGKSVAEAGAAIGIKRETARKYEARRKAEERAES